MDIIAFFDYQGRHISENLPLTYDEVENVLEYLGVDYKGTNWRESFCYLEGLNVSFDFVSHTESELHCRVRDFTVQGWNFIIMNLLAQAIDSNLRDNSDDYDIISAYLDATGGGCDPEELINIIMQKDDINIYYGDHDGDTIEERFGKYDFGDRVDYDFWEYVDFHSIGCDHAYNVTFGDDFWIYDDDLGSVDETCYSFEDICSEYNWPLDDDEAAEIHARTQRSTATASANKYRVPTPLTFTSQEVMDFILEGV